VCDADLTASRRRADRGRAARHPDEVHARFVLSAERSPSAMDEGVAYVVRPYDVDEPRRLIEG
jgi:hypothetical protein